MLKQKLYGTPNTNTKLFRLAVSALLAAGTALSANAIGAITFTNPHWVYSNRAFAQDVGEKVYQQASDAVVTIKVSDGSGSGSIISSDGLVLTCAHVVGNARTVTVVLKDGREFPAKPIAFGDFGNNHLDLAVLQIQGPNNLPTLPKSYPGSVRVHW